MEKLNSVNFYDYKYKVFPKITIYVDRVGNWVPKDEKDVRNYTYIRQNTEVNLGITRFYIFDNKKILNQSDTLSYLRSLKDAMQESCFYIIDEISFFSDFENKKWQGYNQVWHNL